MGEPVKKMKRECAFTWCHDEVHCKGLCSRHYCWELYHRTQGHGVAYFQRYQKAHEELATRAKAKLEVPRRLRRVK